MNTITFRQDKEKQICGFTSVGHVGYAPSGEDIICAGVSALVINTVNSLDRLTDAEVVVSAQEEEGRIDCSVSSYNQSDVQLLLRSLWIGMTEIQNSYGSEYIRIIFEEV